jgi:hypothetical protein
MGRGEVIQPLSVDVTSLHDKLRRLSFPRLYFLFY